MNIILKTILFTAFITLSMLSTAEDFSETYIEHANIVLNVNKAEDAKPQHGYLITKACDDCKQVRIEIDNATEFFLNGRRIDVAELALKIDWQGMVFFSNETPKTATQIMLQ